MRGMGVSGRKWELTGGNGSLWVDGRYFFFRYYGSVLPVVGPS